jgi:hypothetical protein
MSGLKPGRTRSKSRMQYSLEIISYSPKTEGKKKEDP